MAAVIDKMAACQKLSLVRYCDLTEIERKSGDNVSDIYDPVRSVPFPVDFGNLYVVIEVAMFIQNVTLTSILRYKRIFFKLFLIK